MKTIDLTPKEMAFKRSIKAVRMQRATLDAALRTGKRIGVSVGQTKGVPKNEPGKPYNVQLCAFRLNRRGEPTGGAEVTTLATGLNEAEVIAFMQSWKP